jgi:hypothetical protein
MIKHKIKPTKKSIAIVLTVGLMGIFGCTSQEETYLYGSWIWEGSGNTAEKITGFTLGKEGLASTINIRQNHYETWLLDDNALILEGKKIKDTCLELDMPDEQIQIFFAKWAGKMRDWDKQLQRKINDYKANE